MSNLARFAIGVALLVLLTGSNALSQTKSQAITKSQSDEVVGVELGTSPVCHQVKISGVTIKKARVYGHRQDLIKFLNEVGAPTDAFFMKCIDCPCLFEAILTGECIYRDSPKSTWGGGNIPLGTVVVIVDDGGEFVNVYKASQEGSGCTAELCVNTKGEISLSLKCGNMKIDVSTSGDVSVSLSGGGASVSVPLKKGKQ